MKYKWPAISPDMNPIENLWDFMKRELRSQGEVLSADQLFEVLKKIWEGFTAEFIRGFTFSMRRRVLCLYQENGGHAHY